MRTSRRFPSPCVVCGRLMRPASSTLEAWPGTVLHSSHGVCAACASRAERARKTRDRARSAQSCRHVDVVMPERVWGRLASLADEQETTVGGLIADAVEGIVAPRLARDEVSETRRNALALMCEAGMGVEAIAAQLHTDPKRVGLWLAQCGLQTRGQRIRAKGKAKAA